ncbi:sulfotransferase family protein [Frigidibacter oleivorans]|uniref:sulfotransferase family protein n=1 Tax=Frigidibacter oleivorans TaxID=2487129 RepID=UPI000F8F5BEE|nr:sulfotransferase family protein [Frigidibacter oleivorans]
MTAETDPPAARPAPKMPPRGAAHDGLVTAMGNRLLPFYRRFPVAGPLALTTLDPRGAILPAQRVFYSRMPKVANSTISRALALQGGHGAALARGGRAKELMTRPSRLGPRRAAELADPDSGWFRFTVVRNPYTRTLSAFLGKILSRAAQSRPFYAWFDPPAPRPPVFRDFVEFLAAGGLWHDIHWAPQSDVLLLPVDRFDFIGRFETLEADLQTALHRGFGADTVLDLRPAGPSTGASAKRAQHYDAETRAMVARLYARDFSIFGYDPDA